MRARAGSVASLMTVALLSVAAVGCSAKEAVGPSSPTPDATGEPATGRTVEETVPTPSLEGSLLGDPAERHLVIHLPPSYDSSDARYPVVYFLAGADEIVGQLRAEAAAMWEQMQQPGMRELIVVELDGESSMGNTFYTNSPVTGNAEDALTTDVLAYVDATYRTLPDQASRGLSGFSMGGSGTVNVGLHRPDLFAALYAASPGLFRPEDGLAKFLEDNGAWASYGAAFAPDPAAPYPHHLPIDPQVPLAQQDQAAVAAWESGYGDLANKVALETTRSPGPDEVPLTVRLVWGSADQYTWIPEGSEYLAGLLGQAGVPVTTSVFEGGHQRGPDFAVDVVTFFSEHLAGE